MITGFPNVRSRRLRTHPALRDLVQETRVSVKDLILPLFIHHGENIRNPISSMPGQYQLSVDQLPKTIADIVALGIPGVLLFGLPKHKDAMGSDACDQNGITQQAIKTIKTLAPELLVIGDVCFCEYTDHGHCGVITERGGLVDVDNDKTLTLLAKQAVVQAQAGVDVVAPSGMMDGMVQAIRHGLDEEGFQHIPILSYSVKFSSSLYGPFREATDGAPQFGDRKTYQMQPGNGAETLREIELDVQEGADMIMVKPAQFYLDVIARAKQTYPAIPLAAYQVSGEYAMIKAAATNGWLDETKTMLESLTAIKRAGADMIITYFAKDFAELS